MDTRTSAGPSTKIVLLERIRSPRDEHAWQLFVELYTPLIERYCRRFGVQEADAQDVAQAVFRNLVRFIDQFEYDAERGRFRSWMGVVVSREIQRHLQRHARPGRGPGDGAHDSLLNGISNQVDPSWCDDFNAYMLDVAWRNIQPSFDEPTQLAFQWTWLEDTDAKQAAARLNKPVAWVYKARYRVLQRLRAELDRLGSDEPLLNRE